MISLTRGYLYGIVPQENIEYVTEISLGNRNIKEIVDVYVFKSLYRLERLELNNNELREIEFDVFRDLPSLKILFLNGNRLRKIDNHLFKPLGSLKKLALSQNELKWIDSNAFQSLANLKYLFLDNNCLKKLEANLFNDLFSLKVLLLNNNQINELNINVFQDLTQLVELNLNGNMLTKIDSNLFESLVNLEYLNLSDNHISEIHPNAFKDLHRLLKLHLHLNKLKSIDSNLFRTLSKIENLSLSDNELIQFDSNMLRNLQSLKKLYLGGNKLKKIDSNMFNGLFQLEILFLNNNEIKELDSNSFTDLVNLKELLLNNNRFESLSSKCFESLRSINLICLFNETDQLLRMFSFSKKSFGSYHKPFTQCIFLECFPEFKEKKFINDWNVFLRQFSDSTQNSRLNQNSIVNKSSVIGKIYNQKYEVKNLIGSGSFGSVYLTYDLYEAKNKSMKIFNNPDFKSCDDIDLLLSLKNQNLANYLDAFVNEANKLCLIVEYCENKNLAHRIDEAVRTSKKFTDYQILIWTLEATNGLRFLHSNGIIHQNIKPKNILLTRNDSVKISDFGVIKMIQKMKKIIFTGARAYMSPEIYKCISKSSDYSDNWFNADVWSLGCVLYELLSLKLAYRLGPIDNWPQPDFGYSPLFSIILKRMLERDREKRIKSDDLYICLLSFTNNMQDEEDDELIF